METPKEEVMGASKKHDVSFGLPRLGRILTLSDLLTAFFFSGFPSFPWLADQS
jgi:hypothetical protein